MDGVEGDGSSGVSLYAEFTAVPGRERELADQVRALVVRVRSEPGNRAFDAWRRSERPAEYVVVETYADQKAFETHLSPPHTREFNECIADLVVGGGSRLTWLSPVGP